MFFTQQRIGFNGQLHEATMAWQLLGNGHRAYNAVLMRFHSPDALSPFDEGGFNAYAYCSGDPVNRIDPSGSRAVSWFGLAASVAVAAGLGYGASQMGDDKLMQATVYGLAGVVLVGGISFAALSHRFGRQSSAISAQEEALLQAASRRQVIRQRELDESWIRPPSARSHARIWNPDLPPSHTRTATAASRSRHSPATAPRMGPPPYPEGPPPPYEVPSRRLGRQSTAAAQGVEPGRSLDISLRRHASATESNAAPQRRNVGVIQAARQMRAGQLR